MAEWITNLLIVNVSLLNFFDFIFKCILRIKTRSRTLLFFQLNLPKINILFDQLHLALINNDRLIGFLILEFRDCIQSLLHLLKGTLWIVEDLAFEYTIVQ